MIRSDVGVTAHAVRATEAVCAREPSRLGFTTRLECVVADRRVVRFFVIA